MPTILSITSKSSDGVFASPACLATSRRRLNAAPLPDTRNGAAFFQGIHIRRLVSYSLFAMRPAMTVPIAKIQSLRPSDETSDELTKTAHTGEHPHATRTSSSRSPSRLPHRRTGRLRRSSYLLALPACLTCSLRHTMRFSMSSHIVHDVI